MLVMLLFLRMIFGLYGKGDDEVFCLLLSRTITGSNRNFKPCRSCLLGWEGDIDINVASLAESLF